MIGRRFSIEISCALRFFFPVIGNQAPAFTVASLATTITCFPLTYPILTTTPPLGNLRVLDTFLLRQKHQFLYSLYLYPIGNQYAPERSFSLQNVVFQCVFVLLRVLL